MRYIRIGLTCVFAGAAISANSCVGQKVDESVRAMAAAHDHLQGLRPAAPVVVDFRMRGFNAPQDLERPFARIIGAAVASDIPREQQVIVCQDPSGPAPRCSFNEFQAIVFTSRPAITRDSATLKLYRFFATGPASVVSEDYVVKLQKKDGEWMVVRFELQNVT